MGSTFQARELGTLAIKLPLKGAGDHDAEVMAAGKLPRRGDDHQRQKVSFARVASAPRGPCPSGANS